MQPQIATSSTAGRYGRRIVWFTIPTWIALAIELVGGWRFGMDTHSGKYALHLGPYWMVVGPVLVAVLVSPLLVLRGFVILLSERPILRAQRRLVSILFLSLTLSLLASMFSCVWSCGGHPTWTNGYR